MVSAILNCPMERMKELEDSVSVRVTFWGGRLVSYKGKEVGSWEGLFQQYILHTDSKVHRNINERRQALAVGYILLDLHDKSVKEFEGAHTITKILFMFRELSFSTFLRCLNFKHSDWGLAKAAKVIDDRKQLYLLSIPRKPIIPAIADID